MYHTLTQAFTFKLRLNFTNNKQMNQFSKAFPYKESFNVNEMPPQKWIEIAVSDFVSRNLLLSRVNKFFSLHLDDELHQAMRHLDTVLMGLCRSFDDERRHSHYDKMLSKLSSCYQSLLPQSPPTDHRVVIFLSITGVVYNSYLGEQVKRSKINEMMAARNINADRAAEMVIAKECFNASALSHLSELLKLLLLYQKEPQIVITSCWRHNRSVADMKEWFPKDIADYIIDKTIDENDKSKFNYINGNRYKEIEYWLSQHPTTSYLIIDRVLASIAISCLHHIVLCYEHRIHDDLSMDNLFSAAKLQEAIQALQTLRILPSHDEVQERMNAVKSNWDHLLEANLVSAPRRP